MVAQFVACLAPSLVSQYVHTDCATPNPRSTSYKKINIRKNRKYDNRNVKKKPPGHTRTENYEHYSKYTIRNVQSRKFNSHALLLRSHILSVRSWLPETTLDGSPRNLAAITFPEWPVRVCCTNKRTQHTLIGLVSSVLRCRLLFVRNTMNCKAK